ncbi:MAG: alanine racemase [Candidatus Coproplasma sp.]
MQKTLAVINLSAITHNAKLVRSFVGDRFFYAVVKADGYGHGAERIALEIEDIVDGFCVAIAEEGIALRIAGVQKPVLVLAPPLSKEDGLALKHYGLTATVCDAKSARLANGLNCHIAINTGMNRYGCNLDGLTELLKLVPSQSICGVYSHMYAPENISASERQLKLFTRAESIVKGYAPKAIAHFAASGGVALGGKYLFDGVRCGLMLYGYAPQGFKIEGLKPALTVYARLAQSTRFIGGGIGYNVADEDYKGLYTYRLGYGDGFFRCVPLGEKTLCMDAFISQEKREFMPVFTNADEYAKRCGTISYEVLCSVTKRSERVYERGLEV